MPDQTRASFLDRSWTLLLVHGVIAVVFGLVAVIWPKVTAIAFAVVWGVWALVDGLVYLAAAFQKGATGRVWLGVFGVISVVAGLVAVIHPGDVAVILTWVLGVWFLVAGLFQLFGAFSSTRTQPRWMLLLAAVLSLLIGVLFVANPGTAVVAIALWVGLLAIAWGVVLIVAAFAARGLGRQLDAAVAGPA